jgi:hypothetical protein
LNAGPDCRVIFNGSGAATVINRRGALTGLAHLVPAVGRRRLWRQGARPAVLIGPHEHLADILL